MNIRKILLPRSGSSTESFILGLSNGVGTLGVAMAVMDVEGVIALAGGPRVSIATTTIVLVIVLAFLVGVSTGVGVEVERHLVKKQERDDFEHREDGHAA